MKCHNVRESLLDLLEGTIGPEQQLSIDGHVARCEACRAELRMVKRGREALVASLEELVPPGKYLTQQRLDRLLGAFGERTRRSRIVTLRRLVAAAAAAAILVSCLFIYQSVRFSLAGKEQPRVAERPAAATAPSGWASMVALTSSPDERHPKIVFRYMKAGGGSGAPAAFVRPADMMRATSPGVRVPAQNALYDYEEAGYWW